MACLSDLAKNCAKGQIYNIQTTILVIFKDFKTLDVGNISEFYIYCILWYTQKMYAPLAVL